MAIKLVVPNKEMGVIGLFWAKFVARGHLIWILYLITAHQLLSRQRYVDEVSQHTHKRTGKKMGFIRFTQSGATVINVSNHWVLSQPDQVQNN